MNSLISDHFDAVEEWLLQSPVIIAYKIIRKEIAPTDGKLVTFIDGSMAELFEYVIV